MEIVVRVTRCAPDRRVGSLRVAEVEMSPGRANAVNGDWPELLVYHTLFQWVGAIARITYHRPTPDRDKLDEGG